MSTRLVSLAVRAVELARTPSEHAQAAAALRVALGSERASRARAAKAAKAKPAKRKPATPKPADPAAELVAMIRPRKGESLDAALRRHFALDAKKPAPRASASSAAPTSPPAPPPLDWYAEHAILQAFAIDEGGRERLHDHVQQHPARRHDEYALCRTCARRKLKGGAR